MRRQFMVMELLTRPITVKVECQKSSTPDLVTESPLSDDASDSTPLPFLDATLVFPNSRPTVSMMPQGGSVGLVSESFTAKEPNQIIPPGSKSAEILADVQFNVTSANARMMEIINDSQISFDASIYPAKPLAFGTQ